MTRPKKAEEKEMKFFINSQTYKWLYRHRQRSDSRFPSFVDALRRLTNIDGKVIVETGTVRQEDDWGAGYSTVIFGRYCREFGCKLYTIDIDPRNMLISRGITSEYFDYIEYIVSDSVAALENLETNIDLLYLDSLDYPVDWILDRFGREDIHESIIEARKMPDEVVLREYGEIVEPCQEHQLREVQAAHDKLESDALILLDDAMMPGGGKTRLSRMFLKEKGWEEIISGQQVLLTRL